MPAVYMAGNRFSFLYKRQTWKGLSYSQRLFLLQVHFRSLPDPDVSAADGTEERHEYGHLYLLCQLLQEVLPVIHLLEEGFFHMLPQVFRNVLLHLFRKKYHLDFRLHE